MVKGRVGVPIAPNLLLYATSGFALTDLTVGNSVTTIGAASHRGLVTGQSSAPERSLHSVAIGQCEANTST